MYNPVAIILLLLLTSLVSTAQQDCTPATQGIGTSSKSINAAVPLRANADIYHTSPSFPNQPDKFGFVSLIRNSLHMAISVLEHTWSEVRQWKTTHFPDTSVGLALADTSTLAVSSALNSGAKLVEEYYTDIVDYCDRLYRYLKAAKEYERTLSQEGKLHHSNQQKFDTSVSIVPSRQKVIETIAIRAGLRPEEIPHLALELEGVVRNMEKWKYGDGLLMRVQTLWWRLFRRFQKFMVVAALVLIGVTCPTSGRYLHLMALLSVMVVLVIVLVNPDKTSTWLIGL